MAKIQLTNFSVSFKLRALRRVPLKDYLLKGLIRRSKNPVRKVKALQGLMLTVSEGQRLGVIGHNGAGKSTLLRALAGVYPPSSGTREVEGRISSLFDIGLGFEPDATGWENIAYRGYLQGETPDSLRGKMQEIADFTELGEYLQTPVRYYSSGMSVRLAFAISTAVDPEILLCDEVLSAGDISFQKKARARMQAMIDRARLMVLVSHDLEAVQDICNRAIWMDHGRIRMDGSPQLVIEAYKRAMQSDDFKGPGAEIGRAA